MKRNDLQREYAESVNGIITASSSYIDIRDRKRLWEEAENEEEYIEKLKAYLEIE